MAKVPNQLTCARFSGHNLTPGNTLQKDTPATPVTLTGHVAPGPAAVSPPTMVDPSAGLLGGAGLAPAPAALAVAADSATAIAPTTLDAPAGDPAVVPVAAPITAAVQEPGATAPAPVPNTPTLEPTPAAPALGPTAAVAAPVAGVAAVQSPGEAMLEWRNSLTGKNYIQAQPRTY